MAISAIVPARSGSTRLPHKNIKMLGDKPLVVWTLEACVENPDVDNVIFSTDSEYYWQVVREYVNSPKLTLDQRTPEEAGNNVKIFEYLKSGYKKIFQNQNDLFLLALPTMPLRTSEDISQAIDLFRQTNKPIFSAVEYDAPVSFGFTQESENSWAPLFDNSPLLTGNTRSQDQATAYHPNGAIYLREIQDLKNPELKTFFQGAIPMMMDKRKSIDIDTEADFYVAEAMIHARKHWDSAVSPSKKTG